MPILFIIFLVVFGLFCLAAFTGAPYVPSKKEDLRVAFEELYKLSDKDVLLDLGAGAGAVMKFAKTYGAKTIGVELNPLLAFLAKRRTGSDVCCKNYYNYQFPKDVTVVYVFGDSRDIKKIYQKVEKEAKRLHKKLYFISLAFPIPNQKPINQKGPYYLYKI